MPATKLMRKAPAPAKKAPMVSAAGERAVAPKMTFGRGLNNFDLGRIGVPKVLKGEAAVKVARAAGIITKAGTLAKRYR